MKKFKTAFLGFALWMSLPIFAQEDCERLEKEAFSAKNPREAIQIWTTLLDKDCPNKIRVFNNRGMLYFETFEELDSALIEFDRGLALDANHYQLLLNKGSLLSAMKKQDDAIDILKKAIAAQPSRVDAHVILGVIYGRNKNFEAAIKSTDDALAIDSTHFEALNNRSRIHEAMKNYAAALDDLTLLVQRNPKLSNAWSNKGYYYLKTRQYDSAIVYYTQAIVYNSKDYRNYVNRGMCHGYQGNSDMELDDYTKAADICPNHLAYYNRGRYYLKNGDYKKAIADNDKVIELDPEYAPAYLNKGNALLKLKRYQDAIDCYKKGVAIEFDNDTQAKLQNQMERASALLKD